MADATRARRIADRIKRVTATMLETRIKDPRLGFVTVTDVRVSGDLQHATVFYTVYGTDEERAGTAAALSRATGMIRSEVGKQLGIRLTPTLEFVADAVPENAQHIEELLRDARRRDQELSALAQQGTYAGDANPYRDADDTGDTGSTGDIGDTGDTGDTRGVGDRRDSGESRGPGEPGAR